MKMLNMVCRCGSKYQAREADVKRGWGKSCSKSCASMRRASREGGGKFRIAPASARYQKPSMNLVECDEGWEGHKDSWQD